MNAETNWAERCHCCCCCCWWQAITGHAVPCHVIKYLEYSTQRSCGVLHRFPLTETSSKCVSSRRLTEYCVVDGWLRWNDSMASNRMKTLHDHCIWHVVSYHQTIDAWNCSGDASWPTVIWCRCYCVSNSFLMPWWPTLIAKYFCHSVL